MYAVRVQYSTILFIIIYVLFQACAPLAVVSLRSPPNLNPHRPISIVIHPLQYRGHDNKVDDKSRSSTRSIAIIIIIIIDHHMFRSPSGIPPKPKKS